MHFIQTDQSVVIPDDLKLDNKEAVARVTAGFSFREEITPTLSIVSELITICCNTNSEFQRVQVIETADFGKTLVLDGKTQSAAIDEFAYHEALVHAPMLAVGWTLSKNVHKCLPPTPKVYLLLHFVFLLPHNCSVLEQLIRFDYRTTTINVCFMIKGIRVQA
jgi:hypothetical protein